MKKLLFSLTVTVAAATACFAGEKSMPLGKDKIVTPPVEELFRAGEVQVDTFGVFAIGHVDKHDRVESKTFKETNLRLRQDLRQEFGFDIKTRTRTVTRTVTEYDHNVWGGGMGVNYFMTRYIGIGLEGDFLAGSSAISEAAGSLIFRVPGEYGTWGVAPYGFIGGGGQFDGMNAGFGHAGAGAELRFTRNWGVFTDGRWVIHDTEINYGLFRAGVRFTF